MFRRAFSLSTCVLCFAILVLTACGGGGGGSAPTPEQAQANTAPTVSAGPDVTVVGHSRRGRQLDVFRAHSIIVNVV